MKTSFVPPKKKSDRPAAKGISGTNASIKRNHRGSGSHEAEKARGAVRQNPEAAANLLRAWMKGEME